MSAAVSTWRFIRSLPGNLRSPIFVKEVFVSGRRKGTYLTRAGYTLLMLGVVVCTYFIFRSETQGQQGVGLIQRLQMLAPVVTLVIGWFQFVALAFIAPVLTAPALCDERRSGTLGALFTTPLTAFQIVMGKLAGQVVQLLILALLATPILLAIRVYGGVTAEVILGTGAVALTTAILGASFGLLFSIRTNRAVSAAGAAVLMLVLTQGVPPLLLGFAIWKLGWRVGPDWFGIVSSPGAMGYITADIAGAGGMFRVFTKVWVGNAVYNLSLAALALTVCIAWLRRAMLADAGGQRAASPKRSKREAADSAALAEAARADLVGAPGGSLDVKRRKKRAVAHKGVERMGNNPVLWREWRIPVFRTRAQTWVVSAAILGLYVFIHSLVEAGDHAMTHFPITGVATSLLVFLAAIGTTGGIASERESRTLETLLTAPVSAWEVVFGKFVGAVRRQWFIPAMLFMHLVFFGVFAGLLHLIAVFHAAVLILATVCFLAGTGVLLGTMCRKATAAAAWNFVVALAFWALPFMFVGLVLFPLLGNQASENVLNVLATVNPVAMVMLVVTGFDGDNLIGWNRPPQYRFFDFGTVGVVTITGVVLAYAAFYGLLAFGALRMAAGRLARQTGRAG